ncbi:hypothetical protein [Glaciimonas sp. PCH181]|uniref:hypothetical protein n=1 Tax=Glaciimonas sp. PCH181 TaxID=2133943 RepID=UPI0011B293F4|nr:hypothetical protein [Glaciimonas sp. PCH181]
MRKVVEVAPQYQYGVKHAWQGPGLPRLFMLYSGVAVLIALYVRISNSGQWVISPFMCGHLMEDAYTVGFIGF